MREKLEMVSILLIRAYDSRHWKAKARLNLKDNILVNGWTNNPLKSAWVQNEKNN